MKRFLIATALIAATSGAALAQQAAAVPLSSAIQSQILQWLPNADLSSLTSVQYGQIVSLFSNSDNLNGGIDGKAAVAAILNVQ